jgi:hypothetical protein
MSNKITKLEGWIQGKIASQITQAKQKQERIEAYNKNPKLCLYCNNPLEYKNHTQKSFCGSSCAATYHNKFKHLKAIENLPCCRICNIKVKNKNSTYCSTTCQQKEIWDNKKLEIEKLGRVSGIVQARRYLKEIQGCKCAIPHCGISEWHGQPVLLICDHINGNSEDWTLLNLRLICSNCDAQTPYYKARNMGNGRHSRRQRYKDGKSY